MILQLFAVGLASAEDERSASMRWAPTLGVAAGVDLQDVSASSSTSMTSTPNFRPATILRPSSRGDSLVTGGSVGVELGLMTPQLVERPGVPRFFVRANFEANITSDNTVTFEGSRGDVTTPTEQGVGRFNENAILGQGTRVQVQVEELEIRAGAGLAFEFEVLDRTVRIKPSAEYLRKHFESNSGLTRAVQIAATGAFGTLTSLDDARVENIDIRNTTTLHGLGPGLEVEVDAARSGPFVASVFSGFNAYYFFGDLEETQSGATANVEGPNQTPPAVPETASFRLEYDQWAYRIQAGIRFRWEPK